jgi:hypothetical protein
MKFRHDYFTRDSQTEVLHSLEVDNFDRSLAQIIFDRGSRNTLAMPVMNPLRGAF